MPATEPATADVPRAVRHRIVSMLARLMYPAERIARENHVTVEMVEALRAEHGPGVKELCEAAEWLARPAKGDQPKPAPSTGDGLSSTEERRACRAWALTTGRSSSAAGLLSRSLVAEWNDLGRPTAAAPAPAVLVDDVPGFVTDYQGGWIKPGQLKASLIGAGKPEQILTPELAADLRAESPPRSWSFWSDWDLLFTRADEVGPPVIEAWRDVQDAVDMLRDALNEHDHREQLVQRVQDAIKPHLHLTINQVRLVLDAIEAA